LVRPTKTEGERFSLHTRPSKRGAVYYVQFRKEDGTWGTAKSTHIRVPKGKDGPRAQRDVLVRATAWAQSYVDHGQVVTRERDTFASFTGDFFDPDGEWAREKRRRGHRLSADQCERHGRSMKNHLLPYFGRMRIGRVDDEHIRYFQEKLEDKHLSCGTINRVTVALRLVVKAAYRKKLLRRMPVVEAVSEKDRKQRGVYLPGEIRALFKLEWPDRRRYVANKLAAATGMRAGEITGLREGNVHPEYIEVEHTWSPRFGLGPTKTGRPRIAPIPSVACCPPASASSSVSGESAPFSWQAAGDADACWLSDITYIPTREGWLYLAAIIDLYSRACCGLGHEQDSGWKIGHGCPQYGHQPARIGPHNIAFRPRFNLCNSRLSCAAWPICDPPEHESQRELLGQCADGKFLPHAQDRTRHAL